MSMKMRNKVDPNFNMSSLADIIFLLLIFFLITSKMVTPSAVPIKRPKTSMKTSVTPVAHITVTDQLRYYVDNQAVTFGTLEGVLRNKIAGEDDPVVILDMDKSLSIERLVELYDLANNLQVQLVLSADPKK